MNENKGKICSECASWCGRCQQKKTGLHFANDEACSDFLPKQLSLLPYQDAYAWERMMGKM